MHLLLPSLAGGGEGDALATPIIENYTQEAAVLVVAEESSYEILSDLRGKSVGVSHENSLTGSAYLSWLLDDEGLDSSFVAVVPSIQEDNLADVHEGVLEAAVVSRSQLAAWPPNHFRIITSSPDFGMSPVVVSSALDADVRERVLRSLLLAKVAGALPEESIVDGFRDATETDYRFAEDLLRYVDREVEK